MKISELIEQLEDLKQGFGDLEIVLSVTDHTDFTYNFDYPGFNVDNVYDDGFNDKEDYCVCSISV